jgi:hypothetical protein
LVGFYLAGAALEFWLYWAGKVSYSNIEEIKDCNFEYKLLRSLKNCVL